MERAEPIGIYTMEFRDRDGNFVWSKVAKNLVTTVGKNLMLDTVLAGSSYSVTGPYIGLISSTSFSTVATTNTMASHAGWLEAGSANNPTYTAPRKTATFNAAASGVKALTGTVSYAITSNGTVKGAFMVFGSGASSTIGNTGGTLLSVGLFDAGDAAVTSGGTLQVNYSLAL